jgi:hypothetical protein
LLGSRLPLRDAEAPRQLTGIGGTRFHPGVRGAGLEHGEQHGGQFQPARHLHHGHRATPQSAFAEAARQRVGALIQFPVRDGLGAVDNSHRVRLHSRLLFDHAMDGAVYQRLYL